MKPFIRYTGSIAVTAVVALAAAMYVFAAPRAEAQAQPQGAVQPAQAAAEPAPAPTVSPTGKGTASSSAPGSAAEPGPQPATGSATPPAGSAAPPASGEAAAAPAAGGAAAPAAAGKPSIAEVSCAGVVPEVTLTSVTDREVSVGAVVKLDLPAGTDASPDNAASAGLEAKGGQARCIRFGVDGVFLFHSNKNQRGAITARQWYDVLVNRPAEDLVGGNFWMPRAVNLTADNSDFMFYAVLGLSIFFFVAIAAAVIYFTIRYRHRPGHKAEPSAAHNDALEITWTVIPTIICVFLFYYGWNTYVRVVTPPTKAVEVNVLAWRWNWQFTHANGVQDSDLHVPVNTPVRLVMTSKDVLHSFYAPVMRVKQDIIPRRYTYAWFLPTKPGTYRLTCAEYCGTNHSIMGITNEGRRAVLVVHEPGGYERYLADKAAQSMSMNPIDLGKLLYEKKGCNACHTTDGTPRVGPTFAHDFGTMVPLSDGSQVKMDENYIRESLMSPQAKSRPGFPPSMPSFEGQLKEKEIEGLIAFIKSLK